MNEKLLEFAKKAGAVIVCHESENLIKGITFQFEQDLTKFAELLQDNSPSDAEAKFKIAVEALQGLIASIEGYRKNINDNQPCDAEVFAKQALNKIGES